MEKLIFNPRIVFFTFIIAVAFTVTAFLASVFIADTHMGRASSVHVSAAIDESQINYISVPIVANDTLSGIAREYYSEEFGSIESYVNRIKEYNSLDSDNIYAGNYLIIPVYQAPRTL